jgi:hypothetical protein
MMNGGYSITALAFAIAILAVPVICIGLGLARVTISQTLTPGLFLRVGLGVACAYVILVLAYVSTVGPGRSGIVAQGTSPEGRQYCIVQTYKGLIEPYQVSFYIRDPSGVWMCNPLAHQDFAWRSATVTFSNGIGHIAREGELFRDVPVLTNSVDLASVLPGYRDFYCPSNFTAEDVLSFHNKKNKE